jgi:hypothetical protein
MRLRADADPDVIRGGERGEGRACRGDGGSADIWGLGLLPGEGHDGEQAEEEAAALLAGDF